MSKESDSLYSAVGRPSIPPERLLRALLLQVFHSICSERLLMDQLDYNLLFRCFIGLEIEDNIWNATVYAKNRGRLLNQEVAQSFFNQVKQQAAGLMSDEHFTVDGTLIETWASHKSFQRKDKGDGSSDNGANLHGQERRNDTHAPPALESKRTLSHRSILKYNPSGELMRQLLMDRGAPEPILEAAGGKPSRAGVASW
jgi:transposase